MERKPKTADTEIQSEVKSIVDAVQKKFGVSSASVLDDTCFLGTVKGYISTGNWALNKCISGLGNDGGVPIGRLTEFSGMPSSGKSLITAHILAECQKKGGISCLDDTENAYSREFGTMLGIDNSKLLYSVSESLEEFFDKAEYILQKIKDKLSVYVWDSLALTSTKAELETALSDLGGYQTEKAKMIHVGIRKLNKYIATSKTAFIVTNHLREKLGVLFGNKDTTPGGEGVPFYASVRVKLQATKHITDSNKEPIGIIGKAFVNKNKIYMPFEACNYEVYFNKGLKYASGSVDYLLRKGKLVEASPGWVEYDGKKYRRAELEDYFDENREKLNEF